MSTITGLGSNLSSVYAALNQQLFKSIDQNADGSVSQAELEQSVTANGGTSQGADQLFATLDPQATGSVDAQQFVTGLQSLLSSQTQGALIQAQSGANGTAGAAHAHHGHHGGGQKLAQLFQSIDSNGDGSIDQSELEQAFSSQGLPTSEADQLFSALDPNSTGSIDQQQFVSGMQALRPQAAPQGSEIDISISITETGGGGAASGGSQDIADLLQQLLSGASGSAGSQAPTNDASAAPPASSGASAGGAGGSSAGTTTSITYNADGTVTTTVTNPDGTETVTTTGTPNSSAASASSGSPAATAPGNNDLDKILKNFFSIGGKLASGTLSPGTLGQLLTQQQTS